jgi:hypothetical protein
MMGLVEWRNLEVAFVELSAEPGGWRSVLIEE